MPIPKTMPLEIIAMSRCRFIKKTDGQQCMRPAKASGYCTQYERMVTDEDQSPPPSSPKKSVGLIEMPPDIIREIASKTTGKEILQKCSLSIAST